MSKHDLRARPVVHHTRDATWAHLTVVMASLAVARHLQDTTINLNGHEIASHSQITLNAASILKSLQTPGH